MSRSIKRPQSIISDGGGALPPARLSFCLSVSWRSPCERRPGGSCVWLQNSPQRTIRAVPASPDRMLGTEPGRLRAQAPRTHVHSSGSGIHTAAQFSTPHRSTRCHRVFTRLTVPRKGRGNEASSRPAPKSTRRESRQGMSLPERQGRRRSAGGRSSLLSCDTLSHPYNVSFRIRSNAGDGRAQLVTPKATGIEFVAAL